MDLFSEIELYTSQNEDTGFTENTETFDAEASVVTVVDGNNTANNITETATAPQSPVTRVKMNEIPCGEFQYRGDSSTLGSRWETWTERFELYVVGNN